MAQYNRAHLSIKINVVTQIYEYTWVKHCNDAFCIFEIAKAYKNCNINNENVLKKRKYDIDRS